MSLRLAQAQPEQTPGAQAQQSDRSHLRSGPPLPVSLLPPTPPSPGGGYCKEFPLFFPSLPKKKKGKGFKESLKGGIWE